MIIALSIAGFAAAVFYAIFSRALGQHDESSSSMSAIEWQMDHMVRAPCRDCEQTLYYNLDHHIWLHLHNEQVLSSTPHGQPHEAFPFPYTHESVAALEAELGDPEAYPVVTTGRGPKAVH